jgi:hypothetical protein
VLEAYPNASTLDVLARRLGMSACARFYGFP